MDIHSTQLLSYYSPPYEVVSELIYPAAGIFLLKKITIFDDKADVSDSDIHGLLRDIDLHLAPTRMQLAEALDISRQRIYQIQEGEKPGAGTIARLNLLAKYARKWRNLQSRPMGMILPKPKDIIDSFWKAVNLGAVDEKLVDDLINTLSDLHNIFMEREQRRAKLSNETPGTRGLLASTLNLASYELV